MLDVEHPPKVIAEAATRETAKRVAFFDIFLYFILFSVYHYLLRFFGLLLLVGKQSQEGC